MREELTAFRIATEQASVAPTVVALRSMATALVGAELDRLWNRLGPVSDHDRAEIALAVRRVADKLLHEPTVRVKELPARCRRPRTRRRSPSCSRWTRPPSRP